MINYKQLIIETYERTRYPVWDSDDLFAQHVKYRVEHGINLPDRNDYFRYTKRHGDLYLPKPDGGTIQFDERDGTITHRNVEGKLHNDHGPAVIHSQGSGAEWWEHGERYASHYHMGQHHDYIFTANGKNQHAYSKEDFNKYLNSIGHPNYDH